MTDSENSQPQDDSDDDIYKDIPEFNFEDELAKLEGSKETFKQEANDLSVKVKELTEENKELKKSNEVLKKNLSTLLKTAQTEVQRKDSMIQELREKLDSFTFRRNKSVTYDKCTGTDDLEFNTETKEVLEKEKSVGHKKRSKSYENWTSSDSERKFIQDEEKKKESWSVKEENIYCDSSNRKSCFYRENSKNFRHSDSSHDTYNDRHKERKSTRFEGCSECRRSFRENYRDHLKYDSFDKKRHSRSSDSRFMSPRRNSRERRDGNRRGDSFDRRRRSNESFERHRNSRKDRSRSRDTYRRSIESTFEKPKKRSLVDKDSVKTKEQKSVKSKVSDPVNNLFDVIESENLIGNLEKRTVEENEDTILVKSKQQIKEKRSGKPEKRSNQEIFNAKSPLDALYNDMITSRSSNRFSSSKSGTSQAECNHEDDETSSNSISENQSGEDWALSFRNERHNKPKPMTLYSRRMMRKFSSELQNTEKLVIEEEMATKEETQKNTECKKIDTIEEVEKEPGELTDDEHIVESSKEFQELTKVASIENELIENPEQEKSFKDSNRRESYKMEIVNVEPIVKESKKEMEKPTTEKEELSANKEIEPNKNTLEVTEFSPFKSNYHLIEISPVKPVKKEHVLDFYNRRIPPPKSLEPNTPNLSEEQNAQIKTPSKPLDTSEEKDSWKNSSSEKESEAELKIIIPSGSESPKKEEKKPEKKKKETKIKKVKKEVTNRKTSKKKTVEKRKQKSDSIKEIEKLDTEDKSQKRKRKHSETRVESPKSKKKKVEKIEPSRKRTRSKQNSKSEPENNSEPEPGSNSVSVSEQEKSKEDISSFEFFKPVAKSDTKAENSVSFTEADKSVSTPTDYKMMTSMSISGVVRLETPDKCVEKLKNLLINEQMIFNILDSKNNSQFSPVIGSEFTEMTPRRMLKNDLMLTDSEDDSFNKKDVEECEDEKEDREEVEEKEAGEMSESENSECDSDSGASDFVDSL